MKYLILQKRTQNVPKKGVDFIDVLSYIDALLYSLHIALVAITDILLQNLHCK